MANNILAFDKLPKDVQAKLIELQIPASNNFVFIPHLSKFYWLAIAAGIGWCVYMFASTQEYLWEDWMFWLLAGGSLILVSLALFSIYKIISSKLAKLKDGFLFTHDECIKTKGRRIEFWSLKELEGFQFREDIKTIEIWIGERVEKIKAENADDARRLEREFVEWRNNANDSFLRPFAKPELAPNNSSRYAAMFGGLLVLLGVSFGVAYAAKIVNRNYDDEQTWKRLGGGTTIGDYDEYLKRHPNGKYKPEAERKMSEIFAKLKDDYDKKSKPSADEAAVKGFSEFLETLGKLSNRTIYVRIRETRELDDAVARKMKEDYGLPISTYDYSIPKSEEPFRKDKLLKDFSLVFLPAARSASLNYEMSDNPPAGATVVDINYVARSVETYYRFVWVSNGSPTTFYNPGAEFVFDMTLKSADAKELYKTNYVSYYTNLGMGGYFDMRDAANYSFDKIYFSAVSRDFCEYLGRQFGFVE